MTPFVLLLLALPGGSGTRSDGATTLELEVDARELPRRLLHTRVEIPCRPGKFAVWYPKWIQGTHGESGPLKNVAGLRVEDPLGRPIRWQRDDVELFRVIADVPEGAGHLTA